MLLTPRRVLGAAAIAGGLTLLAAPAAQAVVDPVHTLTCLAEAPTGAVDPSAALDPMTLLAVPEVPGTNCLGP
ncbi:hypothetical protein [Nonomuraea gerenzanensis]|uniref:Secreted protein n=1 Tax=Nonomuraea gerenzanensis TaxID=93944 RepID=A0A1M4EI69_9ACTN|nr:hypothetical protein [Nonomuraea gerenzanensis]UBU10113.1 hypothetical protein LCN96_37960 [Nonomuraea gerenzanensis]SBO98486.1 hypothetical protein BN4615_P8002 [Nonomuraea gerenzanensis]